MAIPGTWVDGTAYPPQRPSEGNPPVATVVFEQRTAAPLGAIVQYRQLIGSYQLIGGYTAFIADVDAQPVGEVWPDGETVTVRATITVVT